MSKFVLLYRVTLISEAGSERGTLILQIKKVTWKNLQRGGSLITLIFNFSDSNQRQLDTHFTFSGARIEIVAILTYIPRDVVFIAIQNFWTRKNYPARDGVNKCKG